MMMAFLAIMVWGTFSQSICSYDWDCNTANAIAWAESGHNQYAANWVYPDASVGVFQINLNAHAWNIPGYTWEEKTAWLQNPYNNIWYAHQLYLQSGWWPWGAYTSGSYSSYL
jgi:hypothetical protein